jgi:tripartite-type tricarboxylate transporter receptor subunit TctC
MAQMPNVPLLSDAIPGVTSMAGWAMVLPPNTPKEIVDWYVKTFTAAVKSKEYKDWTYENLIYVDESELTPDGFRKNMRDLRKSFEPVMKTMKLDD